MNIWQLKVFSTVARVKSLSGAARILYLSQPAVSAQVLSLERHFNTRLLERHRHGVTLTPAGEVVYEYASRILDLLAEMERAVALADRRHRANVALSRRLAREPLAQAIQTFFEEHPTFDVEIETVSARELVTGLCRGRYDLGVLAADEPVPGPAPCGQSHAGPLDEPELEEIRLPGREPGSDGSGGPAGTVGPAGPPDPGGGRNSLTGRVGRTADAAAASDSAATGDAGDAGDSGATGVAGPATVGGTGAGARVLYRADSAAAEMAARLAEALCGGAAGDAPLGAVSSNPNGLSARSSTPCRWAMRTP